jgi:pimeloyl-ACP methyl ester carboxylesterase
MKVHPDLMTAAHEDVGLAARLIAGWSFPASFSGGHPEPGTWEPGGVARLIGRSGEGVLAADLAACEAYDPGPAGQRLTLSTLVVAGSDDRMTSARGARELVNLIPGSQLEVMTGAGHQPMSQTPRRFNAVLGDFLTSSGKSSDR